MRWLRESRLFGMVLIVIGVVVFLVVMWGSSLPLAAS
jgi:hypothetical protein